MTANTMTARTAKKIAPTIRAASTPEIVIQPTA